MGTEERYNGWTNRETWAVALYINNDEDWLESVLEALREYVEETTADGEAVEIWHAGAVIRENVESVLDPMGDCYDARMLVTLMEIAQDIGSLWRVNWDELGEAFLEELDETSPVGSTREDGDPLAD